MNEIIYLLTNLPKFIFYPLIAYLIIQFIFRNLGKENHSNWRTIINDFNFSVSDFYEILKAEFKAENIETTFEHKSLPEGGAFSAHREYLRVGWKEYHFDLCAAPFGKHYFVSWWLLYKNSPIKLLISKIPFIGEWMAHKLFKITYYKIDTASAFMTIADACVKRAIEKMTENNKGVRLDIDHKPIMTNVFKR